MSGTAGRHPRRRPDPRPRRAARRDDAGRPRRPGDQGREPRHAATTPAAGAAVRRPGGRPESRRTSCPATATRSRSPSTSRATTGKAVLTELRAPRRRAAWRTSAPASWTGSGSRVERLHELNPRLVVLSISGFGHDGPEGGRAGYDQIAQGEAGLMSLTGSGPGRPAAGRRPDRRPARRHVRRVRRRSPRCSSASAPAAGRWCARRCWPRSSACTPSRAPAWTVAGEVAARAGQPPPLDRPLRPVPLRGRQRADRVRQRGRCGGGSARRSASTPTRPGMATNAERVAQPRRRSSPPSSAPSPTRTPSRAAGPAGRGRRPRGQGPHPRRGLRLGPDPLPGPAHRRRARDARPRSSCPARRCGSSTPTRTPSETTRRDHTAPPAAR